MKHLLNFLQKKFSQNIFFTSHIFFLCLLAFGSHAFCQTGFVDAVPEAPSPKAAYFENQGQIIDNLGNLRNDVLYYTAFSYPLAYFMEDGFSLVIHESDSIFVADTLQSDVRSSRLDIKFGCGIDEPATFAPEEGECPVIDPYQEVTHHLNYYLPHCTPGITEVPGYEQLTYTDIYSDINAHFYSNSFGLKIFFELKPGSDPNDLILQFEGQDSIVLIVQSGILDIHMGDESFSFPPATAYQVDGSGQVSTTTWSPQWQDLGNGQVRLAMGSYDPSETLMIRVAGPGIATNPQTQGNLNWSTYFKGEGPNEEYEDVYVDANDDVFAVLTSQASEFPNVRGQIFQNQGARDVFLTKFNSLARIQWGTFYGGSRNEAIGQISGTSQGQLFMTGSTVSQDLITLQGPSTSFFQNQHAGANDAFLARLDKLRGFLNWSSYFGSRQSEAAQALAISENSQDPKLIIAGLATNSFGTALAFGFNTSCAADSTGAFPLCEDSSPRSYFQDSTSNASVGFVAEFDLNTLALQWSTFFGGENSDNIKDVIIVDPTEFTGGIYITGTTATTKVQSNTAAPIFAPTDGSFPLADPGGNIDYFQSVNGGNIDGFVARFSRKHQLQWSTFFGGQGEDRLVSLAQSSAGEVYLAGTSASTNNTTSNSCSANNAGNFPICNGNGLSYLVSNAGTDTDFILAKFDQNNQLTWSTFYGADGVAGNNIPSQAQGKQSEVIDIAVDTDDNLFVTGEIGYDPSLTTPMMSTQAFQGFYNLLTHTSSVDMLPSSDAFLLSFDDKNQRQWATYFGGSSNFNSSHGSEFGNAIATFSNQRVYIVGGSDGFLTPFECPSPTAYCEATPGPVDAFISRFEIGALAVSNERVHEDRALFKLAPNPTAEHVLISWKENFFPQAVALFDLSGKKVWEKQLPLQSRHQRSFRLTTSSFPAGTYLLQISSDKGRHGQKIIILDQN